MIARIFSKVASESRCALPRAASLPAALLLAACVATAGCGGGNAPRGGGNAPEGGGNAPGGGGNAPEGGPSPAQQQVALGQRVYQQQCVTCHQAGGEGVAGVYPTLHATAWTEGDKGRLIRLVLHGMEGPVEVKGQTYDQRMQPLAYLTDEEIAAVLTYVRQDFGNDASAVSPAEVAAVRAATAGREGYWAPGVLWEQTGIPPLKKQPVGDGAGEEPAATPEK